MLKQRFKCAYTVDFQETYLYGTLPYFQIGLRFDHNSIVEIESGAFQNLPKLETLILTKNGISQISRNTFKQLPSLHKIKLNDNLIKRLDEKSFSDLLSLKDLHLQHNLIDSIDDTAFVRVPSLRYENQNFFSKYGINYNKILEKIIMTYAKIIILHKYKWILYMCSLN